MKKVSTGKLVGCLLTASLAVGVLSFPYNTVSANAEATLKLRLLETTDLHTNIVNYDYYQDKLTDEFGLAKTATLIKAARDEAKNSMLFDNGDLIQGNPLGDYVAKIEPLKDGQTHPVYKAMNLLNYDAGNIGNHEFNFGLEHLQRSLKGSKFPYVNANVYVDDKDKNPDNDKNYFTPYLILDRTFKDEAGKDVKLKVGVIGFVPPQIMNWDKENLQGKVIAKDIVETAKKFVPEMKKKGADLIVAIPHSGIGPVEAGPDLENASYQLTKVDGIDAVLFGHSHSVFPGAGFENIPGVDNEKGLINGKPAVMPGFWGSHLGVIDLTLKKENGKWTVAEATTKAVPIYDKTEKKSLADADQKIVEAVKEDHDHTVAWVRSSVGTTTSPIFSYFALVQDDPSIQIVTNAQKWFVEKNIKGTEYENIPVLSAGAPFKAGGRNGAAYYTNIPAGTIAIKNVSDLYIYPNTLKGVLVNGAQLKDWLERSAGQFNQIDVKKTEEQPLINEAFPTYNFDVIDGVTYQIDVTQPSKFDLEGKVVNPNANRIKNLQYEGKPVKPEDKFIIVTNNYRANNGGKFPGADGTTIVIDSPDENRQIVIDYILSQKEINPAADNNWSFAPVKEKVNVTFTTSPDAKPFAEKMPHLKYLNTLESGFAKFSIDLSKAGSK
ncbi:MULTISPECIES: bifunctional 2',3'-cyclic-nucleotide 2'-phosphodiesterase/3'-nucleotidase [Brevibacillus]|jgi:2',3'-cyclic-nucleotide 2'-phosphodiesterase/3'-nucleotidase|uniref:2',3'-cyclic-nucleotide 2'-phosphodiesterase n=1 Tax=Brevibacillus borstelensis AK1 TaxID=1300222 RepID=M8E0F5_9BACL|nr:bifunctional 2',3'-cyclic-nucleotide 2'-phosphodiesterase/3'-nucleotidase [Brevibacillus borstelensis]EMT52776.1 2',3'-cyclic-nucleotide 2'-phosphodiesterase [Brevibacillus borstelensis AK1]KKX55796.1 2', 3'-cyclic nucleotide 2'-phosphodiesterase [Brevibacillus borstelensis cifa_chp40]MBE5394565.1 bifunctional 2',3'-cyclic-nucleotide 2'-phosphodiesterase/3'-nucleotidase [Brevibacillus borstelensis]MCC0565034.1 bifunctional 2',3'-cyclic-nucleotide 2'-phosphodiesterase/3'-nucleotidase [Breviba